MLGQCLTEMRVRTAQWRGGGSDGAPARFGGRIEAHAVAKAPHSPKDGRQNSPMDGYRSIVLSAIRTTGLVVLAALLILVVLPMAVAAQAASK